MTRLALKRVLAAGIALAAVGCSDVVTSPDPAPGPAVRPSLDLATPSVVGSTVYAFEVVASNQGTQKDGNPVSTDRDDPNSVLGAEDEEFFSLGRTNGGTVGGSVTVKFEKGFSGSLVVTFEETIVEDYPREAADVYVSKDGVSFVYIGQVDNQSSDTGENTRRDELALPSGCWRYIKLVDATDYNDPGFAGRPTADGFDVDAIAIEEAVECAPAGCSPGYFKNHTVAGENDTFASYGIVNTGHPATLTLKAALDFGGGPGVQNAKNLLLRQAAAALLNASLVNGYPLTEAEIVAMVNAALASNDRSTILALKTTLDEYNNLGCLLS